MDLLVAGHACRLACIHFAPWPACAAPFDRLHRCACRCSAALSTCSSTVESLPPLKLNARALHLRQQKKAIKGYFTVNPTLGTPTSTSEKWRMIPCSAPIEVKGATDVGHCSIKLLPQVGVQQGIHSLQDLHTAPLSKKKGWGTGRWQAGFCKWMRWPVQCRLQCNQTTLRPDAGPREFDSHMLWTKR